MSRTQVILALMNILRASGNKEVLKDMVIEVLLDVLHGRPTKPSYHDSQCVLHGELKLLLRGE